MKVIEHHTWIVTTDSNTCRIYKSTTKPYQLTFVKELLHPESKLKDTELTSSAPGRFNSASNVRGAYTQQTDPKEIEIDHFAREIAEELNSGRNHHDYDQLIIVAPPHMNGLLLQHMDKNVNHLITQNIKNDVMHLTEQKLSNFLQENLAK
ncbi:Protein required for attachment to host cells [Legionella wadsworthii]|uniref:Protein required for attachment to host cells n=1 Tax=Legionella wadsworthii TaxID=28088 RepID=A0A378LQB0_9GAMM|nr:host attachment protein [Legionella wadsworthii]STY28540.1 Protein required for attachment to host cells [Legionella wadsworthii]